VGYERRVLFGPDAGSVHQEGAVCTLAPGGRVDRHLHAFEEAFYVLEGALVLEAAGETEELGADDYVFVDRGVAHALRNAGDSPGRWFEVNAPQPGAAIEDTVFVDGDAPAVEADPPYWRRHFDVSAMAEPSGGIGLAGFEGANVGGAVAEIIVGPKTGATQLNLMVVRYGQGGFITEHDHAFEEGFLFLEGEIEGVLDGETHTLHAGDFCWSGCASPHALTNRADGPVRWLETQVPQPPSRYQARFFSDWNRFIGA